MKPIYYLDRISKEVRKEKIYGEGFFQLFYREGWWSACLRAAILPLLVKNSFLSKLYGFLQKTSFSKKKIKPFIRDFSVDCSEFLDPVESFKSFNDFFIRKLTPQARPIASGRDVAILPADARYLVYPRIDRTDGFVVKGQTFSLSELLQDEALAKHYETGSMVIARLCPSDYHRFHFPCNCIPEEPVPIKGFLYSVNPLALRKKISIFSQNKRVITTLQTKHFGKILFLEIGATHVGSMHQTFTPHEPHAKGDEKGFFSFGGSSLILLFEPGSIQFDQDLIEASMQQMEVRGLMGQTMGRSLLL